MINYDVHVHTCFSSDSEETIENQLDRAVELGLKGICITDHMDLDFPEIERAGVDFLFDTDRYFETIEELKNRYRGKLDILIGMEAGLRNEKDEIEPCVKGYRQLAEKYPFDFIIGSTHCLEYCDPYYEAYWTNRNAKEGLRLYFEAIRDNVNNYGNFDSLGHLDYLVRYVNSVSVERYLNSEEGRYIEEKAHNSQKHINFDTGELFTPDKLTEEAVSSYRSDCSALSAEVFKRFGYRVADYSDLLDEILRKLIADGKALEINSAGLKYGIGFAHPKKEILLRYKSLGGELITIGSDAHKSEHLAYGFDSVAAFLKETGFDYYFIYRERKPEAVRL